MESKNGHSKTCIGCMEELPLDRFYARPDTRDKLQSCCKVCFAKIRRSSHLKRTYGLSTDEYLAHLDEQGGVCAICGQPEVRYNPKTSGRLRAPRMDRPLHIDHDHLTGAVRGLLCTPCNTGIGGFRDSIDLMQKAIAYLEAQP